MNCRDCKQKMPDYIDGKLHRLRKTAVELHFQECPKCCAELNMQKEAADLLKRVPLKECPENVYRSVMRQVNLEHEEKERFSEKLGRFFFGERSWKTGVVAAVTVLFIVLALYPEYQEMTRYEADYTAEEVYQAKKDVALALSYFSYYTRKTEKILEEQVFSKSFTKPIRSTMKTALKPILNGGGK